jgi:hypothetical protein
MPCTEKRRHESVTLPSAAYPPRTQDVQTFFLACLQALAGFSSSLILMAYPPYGLSIILAYQFFSFLPHRSDMAHQVIFVHHHATDLRNLKGLACHKSAIEDACLLRINVS